jgi:hypothetical protein
MTGMDRNEDRSGIKGGYNVAFIAYTHNNLAFYIHIVTQFPHNGYQAGVAMACHQFGDINVIGVGVEI